MGYILGVVGIIELINCLVVIEEQIVLVIKNEIGIEGFLENFVYY